MKLIFYYDINGAGNPYFRFIYNGIFEKFKVKFPEIECVHQQPDYEKLGHCPSCPGGYSHFQVINPDNNKSILMSFWDRGMDLLNKDLGWGEYDIVQYIGGLGMNINSEQIKEQYGIDHTRFQYPLGVPNSYEYVRDNYTPYNPEEKIRKAVFIGAVYGIRAELEKYLKDHPLIDWFDQNAGYHGEKYYDKLKEYRLVISLNGHGELCLRDLEAMGLGIPVIRTLTHTQFYNPIIPNYHYIPAGPACDIACFVYNNTTPEALALEHIKAIEENIDNHQKLINLSKRGRDYFKYYADPAYIINLYFDLIKTNELGI